MKHFKRIISVAAALVLVLALPANTIAADNAANYSQSSQQELCISDEAGLAEFAESCRLDSYSKNLYVRLTSDIELSGEFTPIPVFGGTFDGNGYTISGLKITADGSYCGLFRYIQRGGLVKNLTVKGTVSPTGSGEYAGGIAGSCSGNIIGCTFEGTIKGTNYVGGITGINEKSGFISSCSSSGAISGEHYSGGIAGSNSGTILGSTSRCSVNTTATEAKLSISDIDWDSIISSEEPITMMDAGGIAGFSDGIIQGCENYGTVGYPHIGYNVGGIVGRQSGFVNNCTNRGEIFGRKDVGGIAGQMEPYQSIDFDKDTVQKLIDEMDVLNGLVDNLISDAKGAGDSVNDKVQGLTWQMENLRQSADAISERTEVLYNGWTDGVNEISVRVDEALDGIGPALDGFRDGLDLLSLFSSSLEEVFDQITAVNDDMQESIDNAQEGIDSLNGAIEEISAALEDISTAADELSSAMGDADRVDAAVKSIIKALSSANGEVKNISSALTKIGEACDDLEQWATGRDFEDLSDGLIDLGRSMQDVTKALSKMSSALQKIVGAVDADELQKGLDEFSDAAAELSKAAVHAASALQEASQTVPDSDRISSELKDASNNIIEAGEHIANAADYINKAVDSKQLSAGISDMQSAAKELSEALEDAEKALDDITDAYESISSSRVPQNTYDEISKQLENINKSVQNISSSADTINEALDEITDQLNSGALHNSIDAISDAADKLSAAADTITSSGDSFDSAAKSLSSVLNTLESASQSASDASAYLSEACTVFADAADKLSDTVKTLGDKPAVEFPAADEDFTAAIDSFSSNFSNIISAISSISSTATAQSDVLLDDLQAISDEFGKITDIFQEMKDKVMNPNDEGYTTDVSEDNSTSRQGKVLSCVNYGGIQGDLNVGGITGSMAIDIDFDPEDDIARSGETSFSFSYKVRDIIESCSNSGEITAKKNYCGGIVGKMDMGVVRNSTENGKVTSTSGSYAGGIAGYSASAIRNCVSKAAISASSYAGGIAGHGLILTDNAAIFDASGVTERAGAVAGFVDFSDENSEIMRNCFVDRGIAGIDGISYLGIAAPVNFAEFAALAGSTSVIEVSFMVDEEIIDVIQVNYGGELLREDFPDIPERDGCFAKWSDFDSGCITFPVEVEAIYTPYVTVIESAEQSENGFPLILADGLFDDVSTVKVQTESSSIFPPDNNSELRLVRVDSSLPESGVTRLRFLAPEGNGSLNIMQYINGAWKSLDFTQNGNYLIVESPMLENGSGSFCVQVQQPEFLLMMIIGGCVVVAIINIVLLVILIKRKRASKKSIKQDVQAAENSELVHSEQTTKN